MRWISSLSEKPVPHRPRILVAPTNLTDAPWVHLVFTHSLRLRNGCLRESCIRENRTCSLGGGRRPALRCGLQGSSGSVLPSQPSQAELIGP